MPPSAPRRQISPKSLRSAHTGIRKAADDDPRSRATAWGNGRQVQAATSRFVHHHGTANGKYPADTEGELLVFGIRPAEA